jgi:hypothetical protein
MELDQKHQATVTKDRTGKFQDETIDKPGEDFGVDLYNWLICGTAVPAAPEVKQPAEPEKAKTGEIKAVPPAKPPAKKPVAGSLKARGQVIIQEIGQLITAEARKGFPYFTEEEKEEARQIIHSIKLDEAGLKDLEELKTFLSEELAKRKPRQAKALAA